MVGKDLYVCGISKGCTPSFHAHLGKIVLFHPACVLVRSIHLERHHHSSPIGLDVDLKRQSVNTMLPFQQIHAVCVTRHQVTFGLWQPCGLMTSKGY